MRKVICRNWLALKGKYNIIVTFKRRYILHGLEAYANRRIHGPNDNAARYIYMLPIASVHLISAAFPIGVSSSCFRLSPCKYLLPSVSKLPWNSKMYSEKCLMKKFLERIEYHALEPEFLVVESKWQIETYLSGLKIRFLYANHCNERHERWMHKKHRKITEILG